MLKHLSLSFILVWSQFWLNLTSFVVIKFVLSKNVYYRRKKKVKLRGCKILLFYKFFNLFNFSTTMMESFLSKISSLKLITLLRTESVVLIFLEILQLFCRAYANGTSERVFTSKAVLRRCSSK